MIEQNEIAYGIICIAGEPIIVGHEPYQGPYTVTPKVTPQTMETLNKSMTQNVSILSIPYAEVSNIKGLTIIIGD